MLCAGPRTHFAKKPVIMDDEVSPSLRPPLPHRTDTTIEEVAGRKKDKGTGTSFDPSRDFQQTLSKKTSRERE